MELPRGARRCENAGSIGGEWGFLRRSFLREWERFAEKVGGKPKERLPFHVSQSSRPSSFRAQQEILLAQRSNGERQMRSSA